MILKRLSVIFLILIVCFNTGGYFFVFKARQIKITAEIKHLLKTSVPENQLILIIKTPKNSNDFKWIHSREFRYQENMYDVVKMVVLSDGNTGLFCLNDRMETDLFEKLDEWVQGAMNQDKQSLKIFNLLTVYFSGFFPPSDNFNEIIPKIISLSFYCSQDLYMYLAEVSISHPPRN